MGFGPFSEWRPSRGPITPQMTRASGREPVILESDGGSGGSARALAAALAADDLDRADAIAASLGPLNELDAPGLQAVAALHLKRRRWRQAAAALRSMESHDDGTRMQLLLAGNFAAAEEHHPGLCQVLLSSDSADSVCRPVLSKSGEVTIAQTSSDGTTVILTPGGEPHEATPQILEGLREDLKRGRCLVLCGVGDGYLLNHLANHPPDLLLGQQQCIHIIEPHAEVLVAAMMIHDWSEPNGPFADRRFQWWVGPQWASELHAALEHDAYLPLPERPVRMSIDGEQIDGALREVIAALARGDKRVADRVARRYRSRSAERLAPLFGEHPPRQPRVLLLTTRFSTVLQHSTRDLAAAFEAAGWATRTPIEPSPYHRHSQRNVLRHLADFQPDLVVQIDHLRHEHRGLFPPELPFVCWIQDDLPNLMNRAAGEAISARDFILTTTQAIYEHDYGYPARQCIYMPKATRLPDVKTLAHCESPDVVYVSNASATPEAITKQLIDDCASMPGRFELIPAVTTALTNRYARGECCFTPSEIRAMVLEEASRCAAPPLPGGVADRLALRVFASVNNALYRQQVMEWAARICRRLGLSLGLYGAGWEDHPTLGEFARGTVPYGPELESLTRSAKINLQVVPYMFVHQRWLDGVAAGGFFLIRAHPMDTLAAEVAAFIDSNLDASVGTLEEACAALDDAKRRELESLIERRNAYDDHRGTDPVALYRLHCLEGRDYIYQSPAFLQDVRFADEASLAGCIERFAHDPQRRRAVQKKQYEYVSAHFTYAAALRRVLPRIRDLLAEETKQEAGLACGAPGGRGECN